MPLIASKAAFALKSLLYFFGELAMSFLLADACFLPAILSHGPVQFSAPIIPSPLPSDIPRLIKGRFSRLLRQSLLICGICLRCGPLPLSSRQQAMSVVKRSNALFNNKARIETVSSHISPPNKERPFIPGLERPGPSGPFYVTFRKNVHPKKQRRQDILNCWPLVERAWKNINI
jgi:hypothetical protein